MLSLTNVIKTSLLGIRMNKMRTALTILGIVIGVSAVIIVMSVSQGANNLILNQIKTMGANIVVIRPGREPKGLTDVGKSILSHSLKNQDIKALSNKNNVPHLKDIAPGVMVPGGVSFRGETYNQAMIFGWVADWIGQIFHIYPSKGRFFSRDEIKGRAAIAVIGNKVKIELFGENEALGKKIKIKNKKFKIVGILPAKGQVSMFNVDDLVIIPYSTAQKYLLGINYFNEVLVQAQNEAAVPLMVDEIKKTLRERHHITDPDKDDFYVMTQTDMAQRVGFITNVLAILLSSVAAISLIVGGVGIMNIMLVSVTERRREIGLRKAVGATKKDILNQFLLESIILTLSGGLIGIILGFSLSYLVSIVLSQITNSPWPFAFSWPAVILGVSTSVIIGLIFGFYPAYQAAQKSPIEALKYK